DIVAVDDQGGQALVQVKTVTGGSWQLNLRQFADVVLEGRRQVIRGQLPGPYPHLICVMVELAPPDADVRDRFYVLPWSELAGIVIRGHAAFLAKHDGVRPKRPGSFHTAFKSTVLAPWEDRWDVIGDRVK